MSEIKGFGNFNVQATCQQCGGDLGSGENDAYEHEGKILCPGCYSKRKSAADSRQKEIRLQKALEIIPTRYKKSDFKNFQPNESIPAEKLAQIREAAVNCKDLILFGDNGTGKTHLLYSIYKVASFLGRKVRIIKALDYYDEIKKAWSDGKEEKSIREKYASYDYLLIDEADKKYGTANEELQLYRLIDDRYNWERGTVLVSNGGKDDIESIIGFSTFDRLLQDGQVFHFAGESRRRK